MQLCYLRLAMLVLPLWTAHSAIVVPGADGSDGAFAFVPDSPGGNTMTIDLAAATPGQWDMPSPAAGRGVYDSTKWAVVFKYTEVTIPAGKTITFRNHPSRAPVVWLVSGSVAIEGVIDLRGANGHPPGGPRYYAEPGPGGFRGAIGTPASAGFGPGGGTFGTVTGSGGSYATRGTNDSSFCNGAGFSGPVYGNARCLPLIGGSGGSTSERDAGIVGGLKGGGAGGGAILIAASATVNIATSGSILADGGNGYGDYPFCAGADFSAGGSGGAIRIIASLVSGAGALRARGGTASARDGGVGRIRIEADHITLSDTGSPTYQAGHLANGVAEVFPEAQPEPRIWPVSINGVPVPADPRSELTFGDEDVFLSTGTAPVIEIHATGIPPTATVQVRIIPQSGQDYNVTAQFSGGDEQLSVWSASLGLVNGFSVIQVKAQF